MCNEKKITTNQKQSKKQIFFVQKCGVNAAGAVGAAPWPVACCWYTWMTKDRHHRYILNKTEYALSSSWKCIQKNSVFFFFLGAQNKFISILLLMKLLAIPNLCMHNIIKKYLILLRNVGMLRKTTVNNWGLVNFWKKLLRNQKQKNKKKPWKIAWFAHNFLNLARDSRRS